VLKRFKKYRENFVVSYRYDTGKKDQFNKPIYDWMNQHVIGGLVKPEAGTDTTQDGIRHEGHKILFTFYIPKKYYQNKNDITLITENSEITYRGMTLKTIGAPQYYKNSPTEFNLVIQAEAYHG
jgi:hypothetical protein